MGNLGTSVPLRYMVSAPPSFGGSTGNHRCTCSSPSVEPSDGGIGMTVTEVTPKKASGQGIRRKFRTPTLSTTESMGVNPLSAVPTRAPSFRERTINLTDAVING